MGHLWLHFDIDKVFSSICIRSYIDIWISVYLSPIVLD
jgi:hypothetical protein